MERPILFNTEMVRAILEGRKTQTRRCIKPQPKENHACKLGFILDSTDKSRKGNFAWGTNENGGVMSIAKPPCQVGDTLWVRETWAKVEDFKNYADLEIDKDLKYFFKCDDNGKEHAFVDVGVQKWHPSIHMPREAARIFLKVTDVRVERLQDMPHDALLKEGIRSYTKDGSVFKFAVNEEEYPWKNMPRNPTEAFRNLWDGIYKSQGAGWNDNPWVWVIEFERMV